MNQSSECERARLLLMAARDGETAPGIEDPHTDLRQHLARCSSCERWLKDLESMNHQFQGVPYVAAHADLWPAVEARIQSSETNASLTRRLWLIAALVLAWRALELLVDLPFPMLHPLVPLAAAVAALWQIAGDRLDVQTFAPELQKRGL